MNSNRRLFPSLLLLGGALLFVGQTSRAQGVELIPHPRSLQLTEGRALVLGPGPVRVESEPSSPVTSAFARRLERLTDAQVAFVSGEDQSAHIRFELDPQVEGAETYALEIDGSATLRAGTEEGLARGAATLLQLLKPEDRIWNAPPVRIEDGAGAPFRSVLVDVARQPHTIETLRAMVDLLHLYKVRYLHLHLTDDQAFTFPFPPVTDALDGRGLIAEEDWRGLVELAAASGVTIIPELDLPGHSSKLKASGYLDDPTPDTPMNDSDVAHPVNHERIFAIVDAMLDVFHTSPYFHIGGDESGAGDALVPFLAATNRHLRSRSEPKRLLVWEGFHGRPDVLPATGDDRIVVVAWEGAYNPPWNLLDAGYQVVNASWKPLYVVGGGAPRYPHIGGRRWPARDIYRWHKDEFWHWQLGTPIFEDRGPGDAHRDDGIWAAPEAQRGQILGGQICIWEQRDHTVLADSWERVPALAERLWCAERLQANDYVGFERRLEHTNETARALVQPVRVATRAPVDVRHSTSYDGVWLHEPIDVYPSWPFGGACGTYLTRLEQQLRPNVTESLRVEQTSELEWRSHRKDHDNDEVGPPVKLRFDFRPARVRVAWFDLPRRPLAGAPDFADASRWTPTGTELLPELRGPYTTTAPVGQRLEGTLVVGDDEAGTYGFRLQSRDGRAVLYVDGELHLGPSDPSEKHLFGDLVLAPGPHAIRVDHASGPISPVVIVALKRPGAEHYEEISPLLAEIPRGTEPESTPRLGERVDLLARGLADWQLRTNSDALKGDIAAVKDGVLSIAGRPTGYLETKRWYRDYELELEWRWPAGSNGGNSGVLVHTTTPLLFYGWPRSLEVQLQAGSAGDFWTIGGGVDLLVEKAAERRRAPVPGNLHSHRNIPRLVRELERPAGEWNHMRIRCDHDELVVWVNGVETNRGIDCTVREGAIALQSEGAPIEFQNVTIAPLERILR